MATTASAVVTIRRGLTQAGCRLERNPKATPRLRTWTMWKWFSRTVRASKSPKWRTIHALLHWSETIRTAAATRGAANLRSACKKEAYRTTAAAHRLQSSGAEGIVPTAGVWFQQRSHFPHGAFPTLALRPGKAALS